MPSRERLTKSTFKIGLECPRKLFYLNKPEEYFNSQEEDPFLKALARGGYQVGALAQLKFPNGVEVKERATDESFVQTSQLLEQENAVIFEAAFQFEHFFVRADIVHKTGNHLSLIEVKSKGVDPSEAEGEFVATRGSTPEKPKLYAEWAPYIYDLAFQVWVARKAFPNLNISAHLMTIDKTSSSPEDKLHQLFLIRQIGKSKEVILTRDPGPNFKGFQMLFQQDLTELVNKIIDGQEQTDFALQGEVSKKASMMRDLYLKNVRYPVNEIVGSQCKKCQFKGHRDELKSGFDECWVEKSNIEAASSKKFVFDLWNYRGTEKSFAAGQYLLKDLSEDDLKGKTAERQLIQLHKYKLGELDPWFDIPALKSELQSWKFPLHFIDFETCASVIPFHKGMAPSSEIAFQFSHHVLHANRRIQHFGEFIDLTPGTFPTFQFVRELKRQLETDDGSILRYSGHENHVLNRAIGFLERSEEPDREILVEFLKTITKKKAGSKANDPYLWDGDRGMVDLLEVTKNCYYSPQMGGSNSLKFVLPAILSESRYLREKYSNPIYGTQDIPSMNFTNFSWIKFDEEGSPIDPYKLLPRIFSEEDLLKIESLITEEDSIRNGGAAMMAYCKSQFTEMSSTERDLLKSALLKYCELDTLAMVMLVEYWLDITKAA